MDLHYVICRVWVSLINNSGQLNDSWAMFGDGRQRSGDSQCRISNALEDLLSSELSGKRVSVPAVCSDNRAANRVKTRMTLVELWLKWRRMTLVELRLKCCRMTLVELWLVGHSEACGSVKASPNQGRSNSVAPDFRGEFSGAAQVTADSRWRGLILENWGGEESATSEVWKAFFLSE